jgi:1,2-dihydroxy-3-keto-5-methylthiopentene dioxygenase
MQHKARTMTTLTTYHVKAPATALQHIGDDTTLRNTLIRFGVRFSRWPVRPLPSEFDAAEVLRAYQSEIQILKASKGYTTVDVIRVTPAHPDREALRNSFIDEHIHSDDEVRFFVEGSGAFYLHLGDTVAQVLCQAGDLIAVPAGTRHWFDMGPEPLFTAIRLFVSPQGWVGQFTGDPISVHVPRLGTPAVAA